MKRVRVGVIGCGVMGARHIEAAAKFELCDLVAIADPVTERAKSLAEKHRVRGVYADGAQLIDDEQVDAVVLALPTKLRSPLALRAFERGKHVLLEKPVAMDLAELGQLLERQRDRVGACCSSRYRFLPSSQAVAAFLKEKPLGPIRSITMRNFSPAKARPEKEKPAWRLSKSLNGGGILVNWGCYDMDYMLGLTGWSLQPTLVSAQTWTIAPEIASHVPAGSDAETHFAAMIQCAGGAVIQFERGEYAAVHTRSTCEIVGTLGTLRLQMIPGPDKKIHYDWLDSEQGSQTRVLWEGDEIGQEMNHRPVEDFVEAIVHGREPATSLKRSLVLQKITDGIYRSAESGQPASIQ